MSARIIIGRLQQCVLTSRKFPQMPTVIASVKKSTNPQSNTSNEETLKDEPVKYFGSEAAIWRAKDSRSGGADQMLWYQPYVISASLAIFLIYFCILREESDVDQKLEGSLFDHVDGLEEMQLAVSYKYNKENGLDTADIEKRLMDLGIDVKQLNAAAN